MNQESALAAHGITVRKGASGLRHLSAAMLETEKLARRFAGKPEGQGAPKPGKLLAAFKAAAPHMGFSPRVVHAIDWLFAFTKPQDWAEGSRPIVWPSAETQRHALNLGASQTKALNRTLVELGLIVMKDGPHGWRRGSRDATGRITEAYGFDLSPIGVRRAEFEAAAAAGREEHKAKQQLRRRAAIARNGIAQIVETASELGFTDDTWPHLEEEASALVRALGNRAPWRRRRHRRRNQRRNRNSADRRIIQATRCCRSYRAPCGRQLCDPRLQNRRRAQWCERSTPGRPRAKHPRISHCPLRETAYAPAESSESIHHER